MLTSNINAYENIKLTGKCKSKDKYRISLYCNGICSIAFNSSTNVKR